MNIQCDAANNHQVGYLQSMVFHRKLINDHSSYGWGHILLHWLIAFAIIGLYPLGLYIETLDYYDPAYRTVPYWHKSIGALIIFALVFRVLWRVLNKPPAPLPQPEPMKQLAKLAHLMLYALLILTLVSGYLISTADGRSIEVFSWFNIPALPFAFDNQEDIAGEIHLFAATALISISSLHALAALKHHFIDKDTTLTRMLALHEDPQ